MTKEKAELVAIFIEEQLIRPQEPLVFVEALEVNGYLPKVYINQKIAECSFLRRPAGSVPPNYQILCVLVGGNYATFYLDNPEIHDISGTLHFRIENQHEQQIFRSFTLMRPYRDQEEQLLWLRWKHGLI